MQSEAQPRETTEFNGRRVLVTGGTRGIGEAIVNRLARGGATVITTARSVPDAGSTLTGSDWPLYGRVMLVPGGGRRVSD